MRRMFVWVFLAAAFLVPFAVGWVLGGFLVGAIAATLGAFGHSLYWSYRLRYRFPEKCRASLAERLDATVSPPATSRAGNAGPAQFWAEAVSTSNWAALAAMLDDDVTIGSGAHQRVVSRDRYLRMVRRLGVGFRSSRMTCREVRVDPAEPEVIYAWFSKVSQPRRGPVIAADWWERWVSSEDGSKIRGICMLGVTRLTSEQA